MTNNPTLTDRRIAQAMKSAVRASPVTQTAIAERLGITGQAVSEYVTADGEMLSDRFKPLAVFIEIARSDPDAFAELLPLLGREEYEDDVDAETRRRRQLVERARTLDDRTVRLAFDILEERVRDAEGGGGSRDVNAA